MASGDESSIQDGQHVEDAHFSITQFSFWINNADTKAGLLATATSLLVASVVSQKTAIRASFPLETAGRIASVAFLALAVVSAAVTVVALLATLRPRRRVVAFSRYSWVSIAKTSVDDLQDKVPLEGQRKEALATAKVLADIAQGKLNSLAVAALSWLIAALASLGWFIFLP